METEIPIGRRETTNVLERIAINLARTGENPFSAWRICVTYVCVCAFGYACVNKMLRERENVFIHITYAGSVCFLLRLCFFFVASLL